MRGLESSDVGGIIVIACYCRVSSARQKTDSQKAEIGLWVTGNGIDPSSVEWFEDKETGRTLKRPAFDRLQKAVFTGTIKTVVVWKLDRISRRQRDGVNLLADWCERGIRVVVVTGVRQSSDQKVGLSVWSPGERPRDADFRVPVITMRFGAAGSFISAGEHRGEGLGFL